MIKIYPQCFRPFCFSLLLFSIVFIRVSHAGTTVPLAEAYADQVILENTRKYKSIKHRLDLLNQENELLSSLERAGIVSGIRSRKENILKEIFFLEKKLSKLSTQGSQTEATSKAKYKLAVFTFDSPTDTRIGDNVSGILAKALLFEAPPVSYSIVNYYSGSAESASSLEYFDKIEKVTEGQGFNHIIWGRVAEDEGGAHKLTVLGQLPNSSYAKTAQISPYNIPMFANVTSDRFIIKELLLAKTDLFVLSGIAKQIKKLRSRPNRNAEKVLELPDLKVHRVIEKSGDWIKLGIRGEGAGWTSVRGFCRGKCIDLMDIVEYSNEVIGVMAGLKSNSQLEGIHQTAMIALNQLKAISYLSTDPKAAVQIAKEYKDYNGFSSIQAIGEVRVYESQGVDFTKNKAEEIAKYLAVASNRWPKNLNLLKNLMSLFDYIGDNKRRDLAKSIARNISENKTF